MKAKSLIELIENIAPLYLAEEFDTPGLCCGSESQDVNKVLVCENVSMDVLDEAIDNNCEMIVSHHPAVFGEEIVDQFTQDIVDKAKKNKIILYSAHTNLDSTIGGINDKLCDLLKINVLGGYNTCHRLGEFEKDGTLKEKSEEIAKLLNDNHIRTVGDLNKTIKTVCVSCGAGARDDELIEEIKNKNVDVVIGGENKISLAIKMKYYNVALIEVGHYNSEIICMDIFYDMLKVSGVEIIKSKKDIDPYNK